MKLIIDGYNLLFAQYPRLAPKISPAGKLRASSYTDRLAMEEGRQRLIDLLEKYLCSRRDTMTIIFDGLRTEYPTRVRRASLGACRSAQSGSRIEIIFSGIEETADEVIIRLVHRQTNHRDIMVVTSDRAIHEQIRPTGVKIKSADEFCRELVPQKGAKRLPEEVLPREKITGITSAEAEKWLELFGPSGLPESDKE